MKKSTPWKNHKENKHLDQWIKKEDDNEEDTE